jgi:hypothetical protein
MMTTTCAAGKGTEDYHSAQSTRILEEMNVKFGSNKTKQQIILYILFFAYK